MNLKTLTKLIAGIAIIALLVQSCTMDEPQAQEAYLELPSTPDFYFGVNDNIPTLGRVLFYDKQLSINNSVACSSCHKQGLAFADNVAFSTGFENRLTSRNSMPIQNLGGFFGIIDPSFGDTIVITDPGFGSSVSLFWDGREHDLGKMVLRPILNHVEMGIKDIDQLADKLENVPYYKDLFFKAYGSYEVTPQKISDGLKQFILSINSRNTVFDNRFNGGQQLSPLQMKGQELFLETYDCNSCHQVGNPQGYAIFGGGFANIGLDPQYEDDGLENVTGSFWDAGKFKIPSLRNVLFTAPYMHDGRFSTLEEVVDHYSIGIEDHPNLDFRLKDPANGQPMQFNISDYEKRALIAFLGTLTDQGMLTDPKFSNPFKAR